MKRLLIISSLFICFFACNPYRSLPSIDFKNTWKTQLIESTPQTNKGNAEAGWQYLINGDYIGSGIPFDLVKKRITEKDTLLNRPGINANVPFGLTVFQHANGTPVMTGNCLT